jgi:hypothetical protein
MLRFFPFFLLLLIWSGIAAGWTRRLRQQRLWTAWQKLRRPPEERAQERFDPRSVADLPELAQRFLLHALAPGAPLATSVELTMTGKIALKSGAKKLPFRARQVLRHGEGESGLIWRAQVGSGALHFSGWDRYTEGEGAMRWYLFGVLPLVRAAGPDIDRSAAGRVALELAPFLPAALLPQRGARWEAIDTDRVRVHLRIGDEACAPELTLGPDGRLLAVEMDRWDPDGVAPGEAGFVRWRADAMDEQGTFGGCTLPVTVHITKRAGTPDAYSFFEARISEAVYR